MLFSLFLVSLIQTQPVVFWTFDHYAAHTTLEYIMPSQGSLTLKFNNLRLLLNCLNSHHDHISWFDLDFLHSFWLGTFPISIHDLERSFHYVPWPLAPLSCYLPWSLTINPFLIWPGPLTLPFINIALTPCPPDSIYTAVIGVGDTGHGRVHHGLWEHTAMQWLLRQGMVCWVVLPTHQVNLQACLINKRSTFSSCTCNVLHLHHSVGFFTQLA